MPDSDGKSSSKDKKREEILPAAIPQIVLTEPTNTTTTTTTNVSNIEPVRQTTITPLPLTKDLLQRKNKLDKLLDQKEKRQRDYFTNRPVTAGLGISTPNDRISNELRSRRTSGSRISTSNRSEAEKIHQQQNSEWSYELDLVKSSISGSSSKHMHRKKSATSVSGSSNRNTVSMRAYSANHRYMDKNNNDKFNQVFTRPDQDLSQHEHQTKFDLIYEAVKRVVNSRQPESKEVSEAEHFDFTTLRSHEEEEEENIESMKHSQLIDKIHSSPNNHQRQHQHQHHRHSNRFSWLSMNTSVYDEKSIDYDDSILDKKLSMIEPISPTGPPVSSVPIRECTNSIESITLPNPLQGNSVCLFSPTNPIRISVWKFIRKRYVETFLFFLMIFHWFLLACVPITSNEQKTGFGGQWTHYPILGIQCIYTIDVVFKVIAYGLVIPPPKDNRYHRAYLNSFGNVMDMISMVSYWIDFVLMMYRYPYISLFKALGALRPLRLLSVLPGTAVILKSLETSWDILLAVSGLIFFFLLLFALIGLISFQGIFSRRCFYTTTDNTLQLVEPAKYCSGYMNDTTIVGAYNVLTGVNSYPGYQGYICISGQICMENAIENPQNGYVNYDNIFFAFLSVYTSVSLELWTDLMYQTQDADSSVAALYYCLGVYIIAFILTFLLFAVITSAFARVRAVSSVSAFTAKKKGYPVLRDAEGLLDNEAMWMFDNPPDELGKGMTRLKLRWWIVRLVKSRTFFYLGGALVLFDLIFMCLRSFQASVERLELVDNAETTFTFLFALEIILRMVGTATWMSFWSAKRNLFDLFLVISTCVIQLPMIQDAWVYKYLTIFQILRLYRLFICIPRVRRLLSAALGTGESVIYVMVFLVLATALCAVVFMQMFGGDYGRIIDLEEPANRFDTFWQSFVSLIVVYTSETWTAVLYNAMESQTGQGSIYASAALSFYFAFGRYIMSGLYIAVVLENFELSDDYIRHYQIKDFIHRHRFKDKDRTETILLKLFRPFYYLNERKRVQISKLPTNLTAPLTQSDLNELLTDIPKTKDGKPEPKKKVIRAPTWIEKKTSSIGIRIRQKFPFLQKQTKIQSTPINLFMQEVDEGPEDYDLIADEENREAIKESAPVVYSLFLFSERSRVRYWCKKLVGSSENGQAESHNLFNWIVMACVFVSILMVILDEPSTRLIRKDTSEQDVYDRIELGLSIVFLVELAIRIIADGFLLTPNAYMRNHWNQLDICVILLNIVTIFLKSDESPRGLSTFRSLRILRLIRYFNSVRDIFVSLFYAFPLMLDALVFTFLVLIPFAVYGVNIFGGLMWLCNDDTVLTRAECIGEFNNNISSDENITVNIWIPRVWQNPQNGFYSFDTFPAALQHLFSLTSTEGWVDTMFSAMSTPNEPDYQPELSWGSKAVYHSIFYIVFMIISQGTMQLFVGVIIEKFKERRGITTLTTTQRQYCDLQRLLANVKPTIKVFRPESKVRQLCHDIVIEKHGKFNRLMMFIIGLNIITIASEFKNEPNWLNLAQDYSYLVFTVIYVIECIIKLLGLGWKKWIRSKWNWFDCLIAISALFLLILRFALPDLWTLRVERYCLVLAAFRLGEGIDFLQTLYHTIAKSMPSIIQVSAVFMVTMCLFAMLFMEFFGLTKYGIYGSAHSNFRDYGNALLLLVRATTGEAWNAIITDYTVQYPNCNTSSNYLQDDCGSPFWAYFLFDVFYIICTHIFLNLFTAVIISNFEYTYETRTRFTNITKADLRMFKQAWADIDINGTGYIQKENLAKLLRKLTGRFQFRIYDESLSVPNIKNCSIKLKRDAKPIPSHSNHICYRPEDYEVDLKELNNCLSKMDCEDIRKRRSEYNIYFKEILRSETSKGIPFASVLTIISYRFINVSTSLTLDPLIERLEKIEQLTQEYHLEKAAGFFFAQIQKRRFIRQLWKKRDEDEVKKLGVTSSSHFEFGSPTSTTTESPITFLRDRRKKKVSTNVPRIVIDNVGAMTSQSSPTPSGNSLPPVSPMSNFSMDNQYDPYYSGGGHSLSVAPGTSSLPSSPNTEFDGSGRLGGLSPYSPLPNLSPASRQNWLLIDGNVDMPVDISESLMDSMNHSMWSDMLREETNQ